MKRRTIRALLVGAILSGAALGFQCNGGAGAKPAVKAAGEGSAIKRIAPDAAPWTSSLNGTWQFTTPDTKETAQVPVPGFWGSAVKPEERERANKWASGEYRRTFELAAPGDAARRLRAAVEFDAIRWGGEVRVNGKFAGKHDLGYSPCGFDVGDLVQPGQNSLEVIPRGWPAIDRFDADNVKIPSAAANWFGGKQGGIPGDVSLRLYRGARVASILVHPMIQGPSCDLKVALAAGNAPWDGRLLVQILSDDGATAMSAPVARNVRLEAGKSLEVELKGIQAPRCRLWWPDSPVMYRVSAWLEYPDGSTANVREQTLGFREVTARDGRMCINGRPIALHGYTGVGAYNNFAMIADANTLYGFQVKAPKALNARAFRGHMDPLYRTWLDLCDRSGILVICEMPNFPDIQRQPSGTHEGPYARDEFVWNLNRELAGIIGLRANHPSIVAWSASNEGNGYGDWERANLVPFVKAVDPTRLVMLSADITPDFADSHNFAGNWFGTQIDFERNAANLARAYPGRIVGCSEYAQFRVDAKRYGLSKPDWNTPQRLQDHAVLISEQTEALRRQRFGLIMPFGDPANWRIQSWDVKDADEVFHALRNALAPLAVSLDFPQRHARAGAVMNVPIRVMSDDDKAKGNVTVDLYLLDKYPTFDWDGKTDGMKVLFHDSFRASVAPWQAIDRTVAVKFPANSGVATLAAVMTCPGRPTAVSLRPMTVFPPLPAAARKLTVGVIEKDGKLSAWLAARGHKVVLPYGGEIPDVIVIGEGMLNDARASQYGFMLSNRIFNSGTKLVLLEQQAWSPGALQGGLLNGLATTAEAEPTENVFANDALAKILGEYNNFTRPNGCEGVALRARLELAQAVGVASAPVGTGLPTTAPASAAAPATAPATAPGADMPVWTPIMFAYTRKEKKPDWAIVRRSYGQGQVVACQVPIADRLDPAKAADFDPAVERLFAALIEDRLP